MRRFSGRMRAAVQIDRPLHIVKADARVERHGPLRQRIELTNDAEVGETAHRVVATMLPALILGHD
jgi:hypothetical protein